jgi:hypothetical protein
MADADDKGEDLPDGEEPPIVELHNPTCANLTHRLGRRSVVT